MGLLLGTLDGLYRASGVTFDRPERVLDGRCSATEVPGEETVLARADGDLYESDDGGRSWSSISTPAGAISEVHASRGGDRLFVGVQSDPPSLHVSTDRGATWSKLGSFPDVPTLTHYAPHRDEMVETPQSVGFAAVCTPASLPERVVVGFDPAGVFVSDDGGETWSRRSYGLPDDVHDLHVQSPVQYLAACWGGLYLTGDAGRTWARLVTRQGLLRYDYFPSTTVLGGSVYAAAAAEPPGRWGGDLGIDAILLESHDFGERFEQVSYPGGPRECVTCLATVEGRVVGGTMADTWDGREVSEGRLLVRRDGGAWETTGRVPAGVTGITSV